jgi:hypothetical protein
MSDPSGSGPVAGGSPKAPTLLVAFVVVVLGAVALVVIFGGEDGEAPRPAPYADEEERAIESAAAHGAYRSPAGERPVHSPPVRYAHDAGVAVAPLVPSGSGGRPGSGTVTVVGGTAPAEAAPPVREVTLDQEHEATAGFLDMLLVRRDTVRRELEAARASGADPGRIARLEAALPVLDRDVAEFTRRNSDLEDRVHERDADEASREPIPAPEGL